MKEIIIIILKVICFYFCLETTLKVVLSIIAIILGKSKELKYILFLILWTLFFLLCLI